MPDISSHYDEKYFSWQRSIGEFGGWASKAIFEPYISPQDRVLEFGCGGGFLLKELNCRGKIGIEVNKTARSQAEALHITTYESASFVEDEWADVIISTNVLEHTLHPLQELNGLYAKLKKGGKIVFIVPCESITYQYKPNDINRHLYTWSPMCIGNLFTEAGFTVLEVKPYIYKWPPFYKQIASIGGRRLFDFCARIFGHLERSWFQVRIVGERS